MASKILFIEQDTPLVQALRDELSKYDIQVFATPHGDKGAEEAAVLKPDLILLSVELPDGNGFLVCKKIKKNPDSDQIPIIILSAEQSEGVFEQHRKLKHKADDYIRKPISISELIERIKALKPDLFAIKPDAAHQNDDVLFTVDEQEVQVVGSDPTGLNDLDLADLGLKMKAEGTASTEDAEALDVTSSEFNAMIAEVGDGEATRVEALGALEHFSEPELPSQKSNRPAEVTADDGGWDDAQTYIPSLKKTPATVTPEPLVVQELLLQSKKSEPILSSNTDLLSTEESATDTEAFAPQTSDYLNFEPAQFPSLERSKFDSTPPPPTSVSSDRTSNRNSVLPGSKEWLEVKEALSKKDAELLEYKDQIAQREKLSLELKDKIITAEKNLQQTQVQLLEVERQLHAREEGMSIILAERDMAVKRGDDYKERVRKTEEAYEQLRVHAESELSRQKLEYQARFAGLEGQIGEQLKKANEELKTEREKNDKTTADLSLVGRKLAETEAKLIELETSTEKLKADVVALQAELQTSNENALHQHKEKERYQEGWSKLSEFVRAFEQK